MDKNEENKAFESERKLESTDLSGLDIPAEDDEYEARPGKRRLLKFGVVLTLLAFLALSYAWLPLLLPPQLDFLNQNKGLSEEELVLQAKPAIVNVRTTRSGALANSSQGTGFNLQPEGLIVTNRHVVESASSVEITFSDDRRFISQDIEFIAGYDLAVIRLKGQELPFLASVSDSWPEVGQVVTIIGNPRGFQRISSRGEVESYFKIATDLPIFSINANIAPGSSGSPVLDDSGQVVGIIYATRTQRIDGQDQQRALAIPATVINR